MRPTSYPVSASRRLCALLLGGLLWAGAGPASSLTPPEEVVRQASEQVLARLEAEPAVQTQTERLHALVDEVLIGHMDMDRMARWVLGKYSRRVDEDQLARFSTAFRGLLVRTYATALTEYNGQAMRFLPVRQDAEDRVTVRTVIEQPAGPAIPIHFSLHNRDGAWKAYDIAIDGVSMLASYRTSFAAEIRRGGIEQLIESLQAQQTEGQGF
ncbi:MAG: toluene tolerance protein [Gammaproteobacteria bacterium]|nr:toluene tolerance protein [Gammaproteobacteria bacterium]